MKNGSSNISNPSCVLDYIYLSVSTCDTCEGVDQHVGFDLRSAYGSLKPWMSVAEIHVLKICQATRRFTL
jgi:hypothetical protein